MHTHQFKLSQISEEVHTIVKGLVNHLSQETSQDYADAMQAIQEQIAVLDQERLLRIAFIGQYNAGKSSIISALTERRDIKIDSDIATDASTDYSWNGILITDTPGLWTERSDHDEITKRAIAESDLLIFVITSSLFNDVTINNFIQLAYQEGYRHKMLLVVNKMSMEEGIFDELVQNYTNAIDTALGQHYYTIRDFRSYFIDAADYLEGMSETDQDLIEMSHFAAFIQGLNDFVERKGSLGKLDTPIRAICSEVDKVLLSNTTDEDDKKFFLLDRTERRVRKVQSQAENKLQRIVSTLKSNIILQGNKFCSRVSGEDQTSNFESEPDKFENFILEEIDRAEKEFDKQLEMLKDDLADEIEGLWQGDFGEYSWQGIHTSELTTKVSVQTKKPSFWPDPDLSSDLMKILTGQAIRMGNAEGHDGLLRPSDVSGSDLHNVVGQVSKLLGIRHKPWGKINVAKDITNSAIVAQDFIEKAKPLIVLWNDAREKKRLIAEQNKYSANVIDIANNIGKAYRDQFEKYKENFYLGILNSIAEQRQEKIQAQQQQNSFSTGLQQYREQLNKLLKELDQNENTHTESVETGD